MGERTREGNDLYQEMSEAGVINQKDLGASKIALVYGQMNEPPGARLRVALAGLAITEYFRDEKNQDVLLFIDNIFRFSQAGSEVSALLGRTASAVGYQPTLAAEMGALQERITSTKKGSITSFQAVYVPADDLTDPAPATTFAHLDATLVLERSIAELGIYPAVDPARLHLPRPGARRSSARSTTTWRAGCSRCSSATRTCRTSSRSWAWTSCRPADKIDGAAGAQDPALPEPAVQRGRGLHGPRGQAGPRGRDRPGLQGDPGRQARRGAGGQLLHEGRDRRGQAGLSVEARARRRGTNMADTLKLEIVTPDGKAYSEDVEMVTLTGVEGEMGILPQHVRLMTQMVPGELMRAEGGRDTFVAVGGRARRGHTHAVTILTDMAVAADKIDEAKAEEARLRAEARLREKLSAEEGRLDQRVPGPLPGPAAGQAPPPRLTGSAPRHVAGAACDRNSPGCSTLRPSRGPSLGP